jgi:hypothetical protein
MLQGRERRLAWSGRVAAMNYDMGLYGLGVLVAMSVGFGALVGVLTWRSASHWVGPIGAATYFLGGLFLSEVVYGTATEAELQPNIDGLSFDEALLGGLIAGLAATVVAWFLTHHRQQHRPTPA